MSTLSFKKVLTLPNTLSANCVYFVPGEEIGVLDVYVTDGIGSMARRVVGLSGSFSNYVVRQENEPTLPSAYKFWEKVSTGDLYYQTNTNGTLSWKNLSESLVIPSVISADILGNAATATQADTASEAAVSNKLKTARSINGTLFDGTQDITTLKWGNARAVTIGSTQKSVDGSSNVSWTLAEIGAASSTHTHTATDVGAAASNHTHTPASIGAAAASHTHTAVDVGAAASNHTHTLASLGAAASGHTHTAAEVGAAAANHTHSYLPLSGGNLTGSLVIACASGSGGVGVGGTVSQFQVQSEGVGAAYITYHRPGSYAINFGLDTDNWFRLGGWSAGTNTYRFQSDTAGNFIVQGDVTAYSDIRLKKDLVKICDALTKVKQLNGYTYTRIDTGRKQLGLVAQEVEKVIPEAVSLAGEHLTVAYGNLVGLLVESIKDLSSMVENLENRIASLEKSSGN